MKIIYIAFVAILVLMLFRFLTNRNQIPVPVPIEDPYVETGPNDFTSPVQENYTCPSGDCKG